MNTSAMMVRIPVILKYLVSLANPILNNSWLYPSREVFSLPVADSNVVLSSSDSSADKIAMVKDAIASGASGNFTAVYKFIVKEHTIAKRLRIAFHRAH